MTAFNTVLSILVSEDLHGERVDKVLAVELAEQLSREQAKKLITQGRILKNDALCIKPSTEVIEGDRLTVQLPAAVPLQLAAEDLAIEVVYEDDYLLVVNKPPGMLTHPTGKEQTGTLVNALLYHCRQTGSGLSAINGVIRPGIVHRLDRDTSGLLVVAKTDTAHRTLSEQLQARTVKREYCAIVQGTFQSPTGTVNAPIGRNPKNRDKMAVLETGRPAITHWEVIEALDHRFTLIRCRLETGRTHQIRVHLAHIGHPLLGDPLYGSGIEKQLKLPAGVHHTGQLLQAVKLSFVHPISQETLSFTLSLETRLKVGCQWLCEYYKNDNLA